MNYERYFVTLKRKVARDFGNDFQPSLFDSLALSLARRKKSQTTSDHYRSRTAKVPAYYNPNSHSIHLNIDVLESADDSVVENIYYHELLHAASHHARLSYDGLKILKSGLKIQMWDESDAQTTLHRGLNEGLTQYFANSYTDGGPAYKSEVAIIGKLVRRIGLKTLKGAYFGHNIDALEQKVSATLGPGQFQKLSALIDQKAYQEAEALLEA